MKQMKTESSPSLSNGKASITKLPRKYSAARESKDNKWISTEVSVWHAIDDEKDVHQLSKEMESEFPKMENHYPV